MLSLVPATFIANLWNYSSAAGYTLIENNGKNKPNVFDYSL